MRTLAAVLAILVAAFAATYWLAGRAAGPAISINAPKALVGLDSTLDVSVTSPGGRFSHVEMSLEQGGRSTPLFSLEQPGDATVTQVTADQIRITRAIGKRALTDLAEGPLRVVVTASRPVVFGLRRPSARATVELRAQLTPPRVGIVSTHHYINHGGAEMVVYRVAPPESESGVRVGDRLYPGFAAGGFAASVPDPGLKVAFFALLFDQDLSTPIELFARDEAGNEAKSGFDHRVFPTSFPRGRIELSDQFLDRVVPEIASHVPQLGPVTGTGEELLPAFLRINGELRRANADAIRALARQTSPQPLWAGPFRQLGNSKVESRFADHRTYFYRGREVDQQVHLGFDLAATANVPIVAGNAGTVIFADYLGIYGNTVVLDHGMGVQSLYAHLAAIDVKPGEKVEADKSVGRSGMTGLAGGDHLHFAILLNGDPVSPVEWWDEHWIEDRITRKLREAGLR